jgi:hypothetical protein
MNIPRWSRNLSAFHWIGLWTRSHHDAAHRLGALGDELGRGRGGDSKIDYVTAAGHDRAHDTVHECVAARTRVAAHDHRTVRKRRTIREGEPGHDIGVDRLADNATRAGDGK